MIILSLSLSLSLSLQEGWHPLPSAPYKCVTSQSRPSSTACEKPTSLSPSSHRTLPSLLLRPSSHVSYTCHLTLHNLILLLHDLTCPLNNLSPFFISSFFLLIFSFSSSSHFYLFFSMAHSPFSTAFFSLTSFLCFSSPSHQSHTLYPSSIVTSIVTSTTITN
ncbi:hypothetical protein E2C01_088685 [Portunus trituberculatus]|uniref:Uncharacterized protein n=1 Tax=Portunus trituberculatus TaxID=210409 RepID=A0A5B7JBE8_PORTR|nr:hypothetical protein [Portunus trituberculatus]